MQDNGKDMNQSKIKPSFDNNRQKLGRIFPIDTPFTVILDTSEACNFRCNYCFRSCKDKKVWGYAKERNLMTRDTFQIAFTQLMDFPKPVRQVSLSNHGEPLMNRDISWMARYMRNQGYEGRISIHTNASLLDEIFAEELAEAGFSRIVISIQGLSKRKYRDVCGANVDFDRLIKSIEILHKVRKSDLTEIDVKIADSALSLDEQADFYKIFTPIADKVFVEKTVPIWKDFSIDSKSEFNNKFGQVFPIQQCCPLIFHTIVVTPKGDVYPCTQLLCPHCLGNIRENTLKYYWDCDERYFLLREILTLSTPKMCEGCYIRQNSIYSEEDMIDDYRSEILTRLDADQSRYRVKFSEYRGK